MTLEHVKHDLLRLIDTSDTESGNMYRDIGQAKLTRSTYMYYNYKTCTYPLKYVSEYTVTCPNKHEHL